MSAFTTRPQLAGDFGMVASTHWLATAVGMAALEEGGTAFDAAAAAGLALHVVEPHLNGLGGDAPVLLWDARAGAATVLSGQGPVPAAASIDAVTSLGLPRIPGSGHLPAVVPGAFGAWIALASRGRLPLRRLLEPAIALARGGYPVLPSISATIARVADLFRAHWPSSAAVYLPDGAVPRAGSRLRSPELAATLERLLREAEAERDRHAQLESARRAFYEGFVADAIDAFLRVPVMDASGTRHAGMLDGGDLARWRVREEEPLAVDAFGARVLKPGPWSQGPVTLQQLRMLEAIGVDATAAGSAERVHAVVEVAKLAFADRDAWYGDPDVADVPMGALLSREYAGERIRAIGEAAADGLHPGAPDGRTPWMPPVVLGAAREDGLGGEVSSAGERRGDTCHLDVVDRWGNAVSATPSGGWLQSSPVVPGLGLSVSTRAQMAWLDPASPSALRGGTRPRTTLSPGMVLGDDGRFRFAYGTPGGDQQDQWTVPFLLAVLVDGLPLQQAIDAPNWHTDHVVASFDPRGIEPRRVVAESRLGADVFDDLRRRGHDVVDAGPWSLGRISAAGVDDEGFLVAAANPRGMQGYAAGR